MDNTPNYKATATPIFTMPVLELAERVLSRDSTQVYPQYGFLVGLIDVLHEEVLCEGPRSSVSQGPGVFSISLLHQADPSTAVKDLARVTTSRAY